MCWALACTTSRARQVGSGVAAAGLAPWEVVEVAKVEVELVKLSLAGSKLSDQGGRACSLDRHAWLLASLAWAPSALLVGAPPCLASSLPGSPGVCLVGGLGLDTASTMLLIECTYSMLRNAGSGLWEGVVLLHAVPRGGILSTREDPLGNGAELAFFHLPTRPLDSRCEAVTGGSIVPPSSFASSPHVLCPWLCGITVPRASSILQR